MSMEMFDPTLPLPEEAFTPAPRPGELQGLRVGLVENTKHNSDVILLKIAGVLKAHYGTHMVLLHRKRSASAQLTEGAIAELKEKGVDFVIAGIGD